MEDRIQKIIQTVTGGIILGILAAILFLVLLMMTGFTPSVLYGICLLVLAFFLPQCVKAVPEKWFYPLAVTWIMGVVSFVVCTGYVMFVTGNTVAGISGNMMNAVLFINVTMLVSSGISTAVKMHHREK